MILNDGRDYILARLPIAHGLYYCRWSRAQCGIREPVDLTREFQALQNGEEKTRNTRRG